MRRVAAIKRIGNLDREILLKKANASELTRREALAVSHALMKNECRDPETLLLILRKARFYRSK